MEVLFYRSPTGRSPVGEFIADQSKPDQAVVTGVAAGLEQYGLALPRVVFRQLEGKLWEIKFHTATGQFRIAYVLPCANQMVWLHAFRKTSRRTPPADLALARRRMKEVLSSWS